MCTKVVSSCDTFENYLGIKLKFTKYLKKSCCLSSDLHFFFILCTKVVYLKKSCCLSSDLHFFFILCTKVVCSYDTFENYLGIKLKFTKYLKKSCCLSSDLHFFFILCTKVVCSYDTFENYLGIKLKFTKNLKKSCCFSSDLHFFFIFFFKKCSGYEDFNKIVSSSFGARGINRVTQYMSFVYDTSLRDPPHRIQCIFNPVISHKCRFWVIPKIFSIFLMNVTFDKRCKYVFL